MRSRLDEVDHQILDMLIDKSTIHSLPKLKFLLGPFTLVKKDKRCRNNNGHQVL
jgi:hypothetical protein